MPTKSTTRTRPTTSRRASRPRRRDAIAVLKEDHREVERLFKEFEGTSAPTRQGRLVESMIRELSRHAFIEEKLLYPWAREYIEDVDDDVLESLEEHRVVKWLLTELQNMDPHDERFEPRATVMIELVRHHVKEEEDELFRYLRDVGTREELLELGDALEAAKRTAPTEPAAGLETADRLGAAIGHARDVGKGVVDRVESLTGVLG